MSAPGAWMAYGQRQAEFKARLAAARLRLAQIVAGTDEALPAPARRADAVTDVLGSMLERLDGRERHELDEIDAAQARLETGVFGVCERCHQAIPLARLRAMPTSRHCATCQAHHDTAH